MKKSLLISAFALLASAFAPAVSANTAMTKTQTPPVAANGSETRFRVPYDVLGSLPMTADDSHSFGFWVNRTADFNAGSGQYNNQTVLAEFASECLSHTNGCWSIYVGGKDEADAGVIRVSGWGVGGCIVADKTLPMNEWHFILLSVDNYKKEYRLYMDGEKIGSIQISNPVQFTTNEAEGVPVFHVGGFGFTGSFDDVQIYGRALDDDEALVAYYAPEKLTPECKGLYAFEDKTNPGYNSAVGGLQSEMARYETLFAQLVGPEGLLGNQSGNGAEPSYDGKYYQVVPVEVSEAGFTDDSFEEMTIPSLTITIPELDTYEHADLVLKKADGTELHAGDTFEYELGDKIFCDATAHEDWRITLIERLGRKLNESDYFYPVYDLRDWRTIEITTVPNIVEMTVNDELNFGYTVAYADGTDCDFSRMQVGKEVTLTVNNTNVDVALENVTLDGVVLAAANGVYTFIVPSANFTVAINGHIASNYRVIIARTEGGTIAVTNGNGETVASNSLVEEGTVLTVVATPDADFGYELKVNGNKVQSPYTFTVSQDATIAVVFAEEEAVVDPQEYCTPSGSLGNETYTGRAISSITFTDGVSTVEVGGTYTGTGTSKTIKPYVDNTATVFTTKAGATITPTVNGQAYWMNEYLYIDFNNNGVFDVDQTNTALNGDLVAHTGYRLDMKPDGSDTDDPEANSAGASVNYSNGAASAAALPSFTLPADMKPGSYRVRFKMDWNSTDPCGRRVGYLTGGQSSNLTMLTSNGSIMDFTLVIEGDVDEPSDKLIDQDVELLTIVRTGNGDVQVWSDMDGEGNPAGIRYADGEGLYNGQPLYVFFIPDNGEAIQNALVNNGGTDIDWTDEIDACEISVAGDVVARGVFSAMTTAIDGVDVDSNDAPAVFFNLQGVKIASEQLTPGIYIMKKGNRTVKVLVK